MPAEPQPLDRDYGLKACAGNADLHSQVCGMLAGDIASRIRQLAAALQRSDAAAARALAHRNKGACLAVGASQLAAIFQEVDAACMANDVAAAQQHAARLERAAAAFTAAVEQLRAQ